MNRAMSAALAAGAERVMAWTDLLDAINVFPVADGDTGHNLALSLAPLLQAHQADSRRMATRLLHAACGNAGNIAVQFLSGLIAATDPEALPPAARQGRDRAYASLAQPLPGTMLSVMDTLVEALGEAPAPLPAILPLLLRLQATVRATPERLPRLREAGVVDSGALGMLLFLEGYFTRLAAETLPLSPPTRIFPDLIEIRAAFRETTLAGFCMEGLVRVEGDPAAAMRRSLTLGESVVAATHGGLLKVHLHADDPQALQLELGTMGKVLSFSAEPLRSALRLQGRETVHLMTDAAGSLPRRAAQHLGLTLLDSYVLLGEEIVPETRLDPQRLYAAMRRGERVGTSQASLAERHQHLARALERHGQVVYLCVGSAYTGIAPAAAAWQQAHDPQGRLAVIDSGAASGRLGLAAIAAACYAAAGHDFETVRRYAAGAVGRCQELIFLESLRFLARGGRLSRGSALFGDLLRLKPIISPGPEGARKVGTARSTDDQLRYALEHLAATLERDTRAWMLLEYSDNRSWVEETLRPALAARHPAVDLLVQPLSLTTGVHTGPGTWGLALLTDPPVAKEQAP